MTPTFAIRLLGLDAWTDSIVVRGILLQGEALRRPHPVQAEVEQQVRRRGSVVAAGGGIAAHAVQVVQQVPHLAGRVIGSQQQELVLPGSPVQVRQRPRPERRGGAEDEAVARHPGAFAAHDVQVAEESLSVQVPELLKDLVADGAPPEGDGQVRHDFVPVALSLSREAGSRIL